MFRRGFHSSVKAAERTRVWSDFSSRSKSLGINNVLVKKNVLEGSSAVEGGPVTIGRKSNRLKYNSPSTSTKHLQLVTSIWRIMPVNYMRKL